MGDQALFPPIFIEALFDFEDMRRNPDAMPRMQTAAVMAQFEPILCEVSEAIALSKPTRESPLDKSRT